MSEMLFQDDAYLQSCDAIIVSVNDRGGLVLDRTVFYPTGGGQPGDSGSIQLENGTEIAIVTTVKDNGEIIHVPAEGQASPAIGSRVTAVLDWDRRYKHMRMHTALHLLSVILPFPVTGGSIGADKSRLDFAMPELPMPKDEISEKLRALTTMDQALSNEWITDEDLDANPELVKTMAVQPPKGSGRVRLIRIGEHDLQPCGGTHVVNTSEIGPMRVSKVENKGRQNRRVAIVFDEQG